jgi:hypothetical protein
MMVSVASASVTPAIAVTSIAVGARFEIGRQTVLEYDPDDGDHDAEAGNREKHGDILLRHAIASSISAVGTAIAIVPAPSITARITQRSGFPWPGSPAPEKKEADHRRDCGQHAKSNDRIVHAVKPRSSGLTRSAGR